MKLYFLKESALESLKRNIKNNIDCYKNDKNDWVYSYCKGVEPFQEFKFEVNDFNLDTNITSISESDFTNIQILYENLKFLTDSQASDERLWAGLAHGQFWNYMQYRTKLGNIKSTDNAILERFFIKYSTKRFYQYNLIARLWWIGRLTYDESRSNPYELTGYLIGSGFNIDYMLANNFVNNSKITRALLLACKEFEENQFAINSKAFDYLLKYLNLLGGKFILDYFEEEELKQIITDELVKITTEEFALDEYNKNKYKAKKKKRSTSWLSIFTKK